MVIAYSYSYTVITIGQMLQKIKYYKIIIVMLVLIVIVIDELHKLNFQNSLSSCILNHQTVSKV